MHKKICKAILDRGQPGLMRRMFMKHAPDAGSITQPVDQQSSVPPDTVILLCTKCYTDVSDFNSHHYSHHKWLSLFTLCLLLSLISYHRYTQLCSISSPSQNNLRHPATIITLVIVFWISECFEELQFSIFFLYFSHVYASLKWMSAVLSLNSGL